MVITASGRNRQWILKLVGESVRRKQILSLKAPPYKILIHYQGAIVALQEKLGRHHHLNQGVKVGISSDGAK